MTSFKNLTLFDKHTPLNILDRFHSVFDNIIEDSFDDFFNETTFSLSAESPLSASKYNYPKSNVVEYSDKTEIQAAVPGLEKSDIKVTVQDNVLTISGQKIEENSTEKNGKYWLKERKCSAFKRSFALNLSSDIKVDDKETTVIKKYFIKQEPIYLVDKISCELKNGVLYVSIPKNPAYIVPKEENIPESFPEKEIEIK